MGYRKAELEQVFLELFRNCPGNVISPDIALEGCTGLTIFEEPIFSAASASDPLFLSYRDPKIIGDPYMTPEEWLPGAGSVVVFFFPFTEEVRRSNRGDPGKTSNAWLQGRFEGQDFLGSYMGRVRDWFLAQGHAAVVPTADPRFDRRLTELGDQDPESIHYAVSWSERHAAYAAGLGTFSLSRAIITEKGMAGRFGSVIVTAEIEAGTRPYTGIYDYCTRCGACVRRCPANAISLENGKNQRLCRDWVTIHSKQLYAPRYGCGKCQTGVPCEAGIPQKQRSASQRS